MFTILSIQVGLPILIDDPQLADGHGTTWRSSIFKQRASGPVWAGKTNLAGDGQADLSVHGGVDKAVYAYPAEHYPRWQSELGQELPYGAFGENLTVEGLLEDEVCIGDVYWAGDVLLQVTQPRGPCWKLARRLGASDLVERFNRSGRTGFYLRVLQEGNLAAGMGLERVSRPAAQWSVLQAHRLRENARSDPQAAAALSELPELAASFRRDLKKRLESI
jgi:MOSC domain-containing protein YiiM